MMKHVRFVGALSVLVLWQAGFSQDAELSRLIDNVKNGPMLYRTPEAVDYWIGRPSTLSSDIVVSTDKATAVKSIRAAIMLGDKGLASRDAVPSLIDRFPAGEHVVTIRGVAFKPGNGTFDDWLMTYALTEKNKFVLSAALLEYNTVSKCEDFITAKPVATILSRKPAKGSVITEATADVNIIITLSAAQCALKRITGADLSADRSAWQQWWMVNAPSFTGTVPSSASAPAMSASSGISSSASSSLNDLVVDARYRMVLVTGNEYLGRLESRDDTSLVIETDGGEAFLFKKAMVVEHELLSLPKKLMAGQSAAEAGSEPLSYEEVLRAPPPGKMLAITLKSGSSFTGSLASIDSDQLKLYIKGTEVPISKDAIMQIVAVSPRTIMVDSTVSKAAAPVVRTDYDTLYVRNPQTDAYGRALEDVLYRGDLLSEDGAAVKFRSVDGQEYSFAYGQISRRITHDTSSSFSEIERYGKTLICPEGMVLADIPPGKQGRPFFKVCIDKFEYPNKQSELPLVNISLDDAAKMCAAQGKRLCTPQEWRFACGGLEEYSYAYGWNYDQTVCNSSDKMEPSGNRSRCLSKFGARDMSGNVFEWVRAADGTAGAMGGPLSKCTTLAPASGGGAKPQTGFRCCQSN